MKRAFCILLAALLLIGSAYPALAADDTLRFGSDGEFKILILADTQDTANPQSAMLRLEKAALEKAKPDLVVFLGDQLHGPSIGNNEAAAFKAIDAIIEPVVEAGVPFAVVFGNHDSENCVSRERQMEYYNGFDGCLAVAGEEMTGCGNYRLTVYDHSDNAAFNLWFFDSGDYPDDGSDGYAWVEKDQIDWFTRENDAAVPGYAFQHIIVPEIYDALCSVPDGTDGSVKGKAVYAGSYLLNSPSSDEYMGEAPCPSYTNKGEFSAWRDSGNIVAAFFGHDHSNSFIEQYEGIDLVACPGLTFYIYGGGARHGVRTVTINEASPSEYSTELLFWDDLLPGEAMPGFMIPTYGAYTVYGALAILAAVIFAAAAVVLLIKLRKKAKQKTR